ncbi:MAG: DUF4230 domain-containing protein [Ruminococcus callidus]|nr:DUF4230 domain-containing protein [Ruminococcus callidus]
MKKRISFCLALLLCMTSFIGCSSKTAEISSSKGKVNSAPEIDQIRTICELATLECYYHNVAKASKEKGSGITHLGEKDRTFWLEYDGIAKIGVNLSDVTMSLENDVYTIVIPKAKILSIDIDEDSLNEASYIYSEDGWNANTITADDQTLAIKEAQENMKNTVLSDSNLLVNAQDRAKKLIENYINQLQSVSDKKFTVKWEYESNDSEESAVETSLED